MSYLDIPESDSTPIMKPGFLHLTARSDKSVPDRAAFTLIEILVVVATIAVLAALSLTVIGRMRKSGQTASSTSNLRQIQLLLSNFNQENNNQYPDSVYQSEENEPTWRRKIWESANGAFSGDIETQMATSGYSKVMWCPLMTSGHGKDEHPAGRGSYALNKFFEPSGWRWTPREGAKIRRVAMPEIIGKHEPIVVAGSNFKSHENFGTFFHNESTAYPYETTWSNLSYEYGTGGSSALGLYVDGHVELLTKDQVLVEVRTTSDGQSQTLAQMLGDDKTLE